MQLRWLISHRNGRRIFSIEFMRVITGAYLMISTACITLGLIYLDFWIGERRRRDFLAFAICCFTVMAYSWFELGAMHAISPDEFYFWARGSYFPVAFATISIGWFAHLELAGRSWLILTFFGTRILTLALDFFLPHGINFHEVSAIGQVSVFGEWLSYPVSVANPWSFISYISFILLSAYCIDASRLAWRDKDWRKAFVVGPGIALSSFTALLSVSLVVWGFVKLPIFATPSIFFVIAVMLSKLNYDLHPSATPSGKLRVREYELSKTMQLLNLSADAASVGMWMRKIGENSLWMSSKMRELFEFSGTKPITLEVFIQKIHPDDRQKVLDVWKTAETRGKGYHTEYRVMLDNGQIRWFDSRGKVEFCENKPKLIHGASMDITERKIAEESVHKLSRMLIDSQEKERAWVAHALHDDLSQRLALLSIQLAELCADELKPEYLREKVDSLTTQIQHLSADIHRISHDLHPAKLYQLGLGAALRSYCREMSSVYPVKIEFIDKTDLPQFLAEDVSLCLYRITQEALQNAIKHSGASCVKVNIEIEDGEIRLLISDKGCGFDIETVKAKETLGLISIQERIRTVKGTIKIESKIGAGTKIEARVPLDRAIQT